MLKTFPSRSGKLTAVYNDIFVHSRYDPFLEAERFIEEQNIRKNSVVILFDPGLGYIIDILKIRNPGIRIIALFFHADFYMLNKEKTPSWYFGSDTPLNSFLERNISDEDIDSLIVVEWQPSIRCSPEIARFVIKSTLQFMRQRQGSRLTDAFFGKRWIKNSLRNFLFLEKYCRLKITRNPIIIAASGNSLLQSLPVLKKYRHRFALWALPSAVDALLTFNIIPDVVVISDGGYYSSIHVQNMFRDSCIRRFSETICVAMPLSSVSFHQLQNYPIQLIDQNVFYETMFIGTQEFQAINCSVNGTVSGTALELSKHLGAGPVIFAGLDFATDDIRSHVLPHAFERYSRDIASRTSPYYHSSFVNAVSTYPLVREGNTARKSPALVTYAGWFEAHGYPDSRLYRLNPTNVHIASMKEIQNNDLSALLMSETIYKPRFEQIAAPGFGKRKKVALNVINEWTEWTHAYNRQNRSTERRSAGNLYADELYRMTSSTGEEPLSFLEKLHDFVNDTQMPEETTYGI